SAELHAELGLEDDGSLAIHDADSGERWLTAEEAADAEREAADLGRLAAEARSLDLEAEVQRLRRRLEELDN
ncbi:MAG: hypothetical protein KDA71_20945, partial [Planctomycetales bacterium]|nr:hypothetical protein [Planctomycetales bacterium]